MKRNSGEKFQNDKVKISKSKENHFKITSNERKGEGSTDHPKSKEKFQMNILKPVFLLPTWFIESYYLHIWKEENGVKNKGVKISESLS